MKKFAVLVSLLVFFVATNPICISCEYLPPPKISAKSAILIESLTGRVIYEKNPDAQLPIASTTKIMTALLTIESGGLDEEFVVDTEAIHVEGSSMGLVDGDIVTKRALCCGMLLPSGNDAANAAAVSLAGSITGFAELMNSRAALLGMNNTSFVTPSGLHDDAHYSTARDMATLARCAMSNEVFREICSQEYTSAVFGNPPYERRLRNTNVLLKRYPDCIGIKTGFTDEAGRCLVSSAVRDGVELICVTLNAPDDWNDHAALYDFAWSGMTPAALGYPVLEIPLAGEERYVTLEPTEPVIIGVFGDDGGGITCKAIVPHFLYSVPNKSVGRLCYYIGGQLIAERELIVAQTS